MTNLRCLRHPDYKGTTFTQDGCYNCVQMFTQVLREQRERALKAATQTNSGVSK